MRFLLFSGFCKSNAGSVWIISQTENFLDFCRRSSTPEQTDETFETHKIEVTQGRDRVDEGAIETKFVSQLVETTAEVGSMLHSNHKQIPSFQSIRFKKRFLSRQGVILLWKTHNRLPTTELSSGIEK